MPKWVEVAVSISEEWIESLSYALRETGVNGIAIDDPGALRSLSATEPEIRPDIIPPHGAPAVVKAYFPWETQEKQLQKLAEILESMSLPISKVETREMEEKEWQDAWKIYYKPVKVGNKLVIKPEWEEYSTQEDEIVIQMDPGQAFGTGTHPTTAMCLELIEEYVAAGDSVIDVGTGSGILAVTAALLGSARVLALDMDKVAVQMAAENTRRNGVSSTVRVKEGNLLDNVEGRFDIVVANILSSVIIELAPDAAKVLRSGGYFIASGIIRERLPEVRGVLEKMGFLIKELRHQGEWVALVAVYP
ncbi:MAG: 50S ribosomal protein L11 methyltransferase [Firmicutes bacterium]|nr:50S ribosomal protein L11 methyltransferase [Bacillota bacterium]